MKLLTNGNNINTLKVLIASNISKNSIKICQDSVESLNIVSPKAVPQLVLDSGTHIFSSNAAAKYLFLPSVQDLSAVNYYLDLEASLIQPMTISFSSKPSPFVKKNFEDVITALNEELSGKAYLAGEKVTVGDIAVWCSLYPVFTDSKLFSELFNFKESLKKWFEDINKLPYVQEALKQYPVEKGLPSLGSLVLTHSVKTGAPAKVQSEGNVPLQKGGLPKAPESPAKEAATVTITEDEKKAAALAWEEAPKKLSKKPAHPVLPIPGERNILITSALPYVNNVPHLGNIIGCVLSGDVFARYCRLRGYNTLYVCGTDEYGTATETKALEEELTPQQICDKYFKIHDSIYKWFNISFDHFGRTTTPEQTEICQDIFTKVYKNGYILAESVEQLLCEKCDRYLADRYVEGTCPRCGYEDARGDQCDGCGHLINAPELIKPRCKICKETPVLRQSKQFFLDLPKIEPILKEWMQKSSMNWSHNAAEITKAWLNDGLKPRCITRDLKWGIPVPIEGFENKVFYVWFDAPIGYISITKLYTDEWRKWWLPEKNTEISLYQFMAKDNVPFHSVMFPASLIASKENYILVSNIFATEYLNYEEGKFSKSRGVGVFGTDAQDTGIPADIWRFYLLYVRPESQDSVFSWLDLALKNNSELLNILGNFINRSMVFCEKNYQSKVPKVNLIDEDYELLALVNREIKEYITMLEKGKLREGVRHILSIARLGNQLMQASQPWVLCKGTDDDKKRCGTVIGLSVNLSCLLAQLLYPYMPATSELIWKQLNSPPDVSVIEDKFRLYLSAGHEIGKPFPLFNKIEGTQIETLKAKFAGNQKAKSPPAGGDAVKVAAASTYSPSEHVASIETITQQLLLENAQNPAPGMNLENIEEEVKKQGDLVRKLKESGVDRSQWQPEVNVLLDLKKKLAELKGEPMQAPSGKKNKKK